MICSSGHPRISWDGGGECPMCAERRTRESLDGFGALRDVMAAMQGGEAPGDPTADVSLGVVIPARDRSVGRALTVLSHQAAECDCAVVVDLGSRSTISDIIRCDSAVCGMSYLRIESDDWNKGRAINAGLESLRGKVSHALLLDADMILHPDALERIRVWLRTHGAVAIAPLDVDGISTFDVAGFEQAANVGRVRGPDQVGGCVAYRLDWLLETGCMDEGYVGKGYHDLDMWRRAERDFGSVLLVPASEGLALHIRHPVTIDEVQFDANRMRFEARWGQQFKAPVRLERTEPIALREPVALPADEPSYLDMYQRPVGRPAAASAESRPTAATPEQSDRPTGRTEAAVKSVGTTFGKPVFEDADLCESYRADGVMLSPELSAARWAPAVDPAAVESTISAYERQIVEHGRIGPTVPARLDEIDHSKMGFVSGVPIDEPPDAGAVLGEVFTKRPGTGWDVDVIRAPTTDRLAEAADRVERFGRRGRDGVPPLTCSTAGPGQSAFIDGLRALDFVAVDDSDAAAAMERGERVLYHGAWGRTGAVRGKPAVLWHSGFTGSDLMGEGANLSRALAAAKAGKIDLLWLDSRDVLPEGASRMVPVWDPAAMVALAEPLPEKRDRAVMVAFCGQYPSAAKNLLASVAACAGVDAALHLSESAIEGERGPAVRALLSGSRSEIHPLMERREAVRLAASMTVLVHPSTSDTWPYLVMESVYAGTPVIGSEMIAWMHHLPEWAQELCVVRPSTSSREIRRLVVWALDNPDDLSRLLVAQRAVLDDLAPVHTEQARAILADLGFPVGGAVSQANPHPTTPAAEVPMAPQGTVSSDVTVFVISSGEPSLADCHAHLDRQDCTFRREAIADVSPMNAAFQQMLDRCTTRYYVQVDADMLLEPWAISGLYSEITARGCAQVVAWLWDDDVERPIQGVKIYDHAICSRYPYTEGISCEMGQNVGLKADGHEVYAMPLGDQRTAAGGWRQTHQTYGTHYASQTPAMAFTRWQRLLQKHRALPWMGWIGEYPPRLEARWLANPADEIAKARYLGAVAGLVGPLPDGEMDSRRPNHDYLRVAAYAGEYSVGLRELTIYLTGACNFHCRFGSTPCRRQTDDGVPDAGTMTPGMLWRILEAHPTIQSCCIAGFGEPLLHPDLSGLVSVLTQRGVTAGLITNGSLLSGAIDLLVGLGPTLSYVSVSLNAATAEEHEKTTGTRTFEAVLQGIRDSIAAGIRTGVSSVVTRSNVYQLNDLLALCRDLGVAFVHLHQPLPHNGADDPGFRDDAIDASDGLMLAALDMARSLPGSELVECWPAILDGDPPGRCMSPFVSMGVDAAGHVTGCRRVDPPDESHGGYLWPWRGGHYAGLIAQITGDRADAHPACRGCFGNWRS